MKNRKNILIKSKKLNFFQKLKFVNFLKNLKIYEDTIDLLKFRYFFWFMYNIYK